MITTVNVLLSPGYLDAKLVRGGALDELRVSTGTAEPLNQVLIEVPKRGSGGESGVGGLACYFQQILQGLGIAHAILGSLVDWGEVWHRDELIS